ncbi:Scytalone dehydratase [Paraphoma chrysanthemicola]|nr:Scytalone dehydratase [Paraphoma chrysanthemicola]
MGDISMPKAVTPSEAQACSEVSWQWAWSYDTKDWTKLAGLVTPSLHIDYRAVRGPEFNFASQPADEFIASISSPTELGDPLVATQHLLGLASWTRSDDTHITAAFQIRAQHIRFASDGAGGRSKKQVMAAVGHGTVEHEFELDEAGRWKLAGIKPVVTFADGDMGALMEYKD